MRKKGIFNGFGYIAKKKNEKRHFIQQFQQHIRYSKHFDMPKQKFTRAIPCASSYYFSSSFSSKRCHAKCQPLQIVNCSGLLYDEFLIWFYIGVVEIFSFVPSLFCAVMTRTIISLPHLPQTKKKFRCTLIRLQCILWTNFFLFVCFNKFYSVWSAVRSLISYRNSFA